MSRRAEGPGRRGAVGAWVVPLVLLALLLPAFGTAGSASADRDARLRGMRDEIRRLEREVQALRQRERGILGELERLGAELRLREAERDEVALRLEDVEEAIEERNGRIGELHDVQEERRLYLAFRLREIYKEGPERALRRFIGGEQVEAYWSGLRYASYLSERDARVLTRFRSDGERLEGEREALLATRTELRSLGEELARARQRTAAAREARSGLLRDIREDRDRREGAILELESAATALGDLVGSMRPGESGPALDVHKFRGLLDWPADGKVLDGFGSVIHPRFKTRVPHPGLDLEGDFSTGIRSVFDGTVVFAEWMRGYGLTAIVDHGGGVLSVYAHASVLLVETGDTVVRGQALGRVGETGSLRGPYLYFELRVDGKPADPVAWLRPRRG